MTKKSGKKSPKGLFTFNKIHSGKCDCKNGEKCSNTAAWDMVVTVSGERVTRLCEFHMDKYFMAHGDSKK